MKGVILAGGTGSRLYPLTKAVNKHLLPVGTKPMVCHGIEKFREAGIADVLLVSSRHHLGDMVRLLEDGSEFGIRLSYRAQEEAGGIAQALALAESFAAGGPIAVLLGDNIFADGLSRYAERFLRQGARGAKVLLKEVPDPHRYGVAELSGPFILSIEEKPAKPKSAYAVTGIYFYDHQVFDLIRTIRPSPRGELEITDVNNAYIERGQLTYDILEGWWTDAGTHESLALANDLVRGMETRRSARGTSGKLAAVR